ncbi:biotin synthase BioB [bacterium]|nr:biotin synthase BioB [bacterium]
MENLINRRPAGTPADEIRRISAIALDRPLTHDEALSLTRAESPEAFEALLDGAETLRQKFLGNDVSLCAIVNAKSGRCEEDCKFCAQSSHYDTGVTEYKFVGRERILDAARRAREMGAREFSVVVAGRKMRRREMEEAFDIFPAIANETGMDTCGSLGAVTHDELTELKKNGLMKFHHNLETSRSHYGAICSTRDYDENRRSVADAKKLGMFVCSGGIFGMGESWAQRVELFMDLRELGADSIPINFLNPIAGTPFCGRDELSPELCLAIIAVARHVLRDRQILVAGGRQIHLKDRQKDIFRAGASAMMIGNYLTTPGGDPNADRRMIHEQGMSIASCRGAAAGKAS